MNRRFDSDYCSTDRTDHYPEQCETIQPNRNCQIPDQPIIPTPKEEPEEEVSLWVWWILIALVVIIMIIAICWSIRKKRMANGVQKWGWMAIIVLFVLALMMFIFGFFYDDGGVIIYDPVVVDDDIVPGEYPIVYPPDAGSSTSASQGEVFFDFNGQSFVDGPSCNLNDTSKWNDTKCDCIPPFFGNCCSREAYSNQYFEAGTINKDSDGVKFKTLTTTNADRLSFPFQGIDCDQATCTNQCDREKHCTGVIWDGARNCTLIAGNVYLDSSDDISWDINCDSNLYLKNDSRCSKRKLYGRDIGYTRHLKIPSMVWVWRGCLPTRYYLTDTTYDNNRCTSIPLKVNVPKQLDIVPEGSANQGQLYGVFTTYRVNEEEARTLLNKRRDNNCTHKNVWFDYPGQYFPSIPVVEELWAIYIDRL